MGDIKVSKPVTLKSASSSVYEFSPLKKSNLEGRAACLVFLNRCKQPLWKTVEQRNRIFTQIWEQEEVIANRTVIELLSLSETGVYEYAYHDKEGQLIQGSLIPTEQQPIDATNAVQVQTAYKVERLSLRQFRQIQITNAIIEFLKSLVELLATPFIYLYQLIAGRGAPRNFAAMLVPVEHDRVGEINHDIVLSQLKFMERMFHQIDPVNHSTPELGLSEVTEKKRYIGNKTCICRQNATHTKFWIEGNSRVLDRADATKEIWQENQPTWVRFDKNDPLLQSPRPDQPIEEIACCGRQSLEAECTKEQIIGIIDFAVQEEYRGNLINQILLPGRHYTFGEVHQFIQQKLVKEQRPAFNQKFDVYLRSFAARERRAWSLDSVELKFHGEWVTLPNTHQLVTQSWEAGSSTTTLQAEEKHPQVLSAAQMMAQTFSEAHALGSEIQDALNSGSRKQKQKAITKLVSRFEGLADNQHLILPLAQGEGRSYLPHFLVFVYLKGQAPGERDRILLKHICFSSVSLDKGKMDVVKTYDVTNTLSSRQSSTKFARALFGMQPFKRSKDSKEVKLKGPMVADHSLDSLLAHFAAELDGPKPLKKSSRDPVKAIYTVIEELQMEETHLSLEQRTLESATASKAKFYTVYVNHLVSYYEENEHRLTSQQRAHALDGILWYVNQVRHYIENEVNADAALEVTERLIEFVEKKLGELERTEALENKDISNLRNKISLFSATLTRPLAETLQRVDKLRQGEGSRLSVGTLGAVEKLRQTLQNTALTAEERQKAIKNFSDLLKIAESYLQRKNPLAAKTLLLAMMQALPTARSSDASVDVVFWDTLAEQELTVWTRGLALLAEKMGEASIQSNTYPLRPHEVFEFNVVLPLTQRYLFQRIIPFKLDRFQADDGILNTYANNELVVRELQQTRNNFIAMRDREIEEEVTQDLIRKWKQQDRDDAAKLATYNSQVEHYKRMLQSEANAQSYNYKFYNRQLAELQKPRIKDEQQKKVERAQEKREEMARTKENDQFLTELRAIEVGSFAELPDDERYSTQWDRWMHSSCERTLAVMGRFAKVMGIPKALYAYKFGGIDWVNHAFFETKDQMHWLMEKDCSVLIGSSPYFEIRFAGCKRTLAELQGSEALNVKHVASFLIGYDKRGDGTRLLKQSESEHFVSLVEARMNGFCTAKDALDTLIPQEITDIRKVDELRKILRDPVKYLTPFKEASGVNALMGMLFDEPFNPDVLKSKLSAMSRIHLVPAVRQVGNHKVVGCLTLSSNKEKRGSICTNGKKEEPPTHIERLNFMGQIPHSAADLKVGADNERKKINELNNNKHYLDLDPAEAFILAETALTKSGDANREQELSYLSVSQCLHFIYQYPEKIAVPQIRDTLYKNFFRQGLIKQHIKNNPEFFIHFGKVLDEVCHFLQEKNTNSQVIEERSDHKISELFIREVCERIRRHAMNSREALMDAYGRDVAQEIAEALPAYDETSIIGLFRQKMDTNQQKIFAAYALSYYCHKYEDGRNEENPDKFPSTADFEAWRDVCNAFVILQQCPLEVGHSGWEAELKYKAQSKLLAPLEVRLTHDPIARNTLLTQLTGRSGSWQVNPAKPYSYTLQVGQQRFEADIRTGSGFKPDLIQLGERSKLPEQIKGDEVFKFLFKSMDPLVTSQPGEAGVIDYIWKDEKGDYEFTFRYKSADHALQIFQTVHGVKYQFQRVSLKKAGWSKLWQIFARHNNKTIEDLITSKGIWVYIDPRTNKADSSKVLLAQHGWSLEKDPITLNISNNSLSSATIGKGKDKMWLCSGLSSRSSKLLSFRGGGGLLLLSKDKKHVDEIRFPTDSSSQEQLILKRDSKHSDVWFLRGREDWIWQLKDTKIYEQRFGKNWREYILPLKNRRTGEEEIWIFPHLAVGGEKRGSAVKFLKTGTDFIDAIGGQINSMGIVDSGVDVESLRGIVGAAESFMGGTDSLVEEMESRAEEFGGNQQQADAVNLLKNITSPRAIRYRIDRRTETSTHAGFFYLAYIASLRGSWGIASHYLQRMVENGNPDYDDLKQLQKMSMILLGMDSMVGDGAKQLLEAKGPLDAAFRAKLGAALLTLNTRLKAQYGQEILPSKREEAADSIKDLFKIGASSFYLKYRESLPTHQQKLRDHGMLLTEEEEHILTADLTTLAAAVSFEWKKTVEAEPHAQTLPVELKMPTSAEISQMLTLMADYVQPYGVWSIHDLHRQEGSYPKWETVLANFWPYWEWIYRNDLKIEDIAFLFREIPTKVENFEAVDTARRTLLLFWHARQKENFKQKRLSHNAQLREVKKRRLDMPDFASMAAKAKRLQSEAAMSPGIWRQLYARGYEFYVKFRRGLNEVHYNETIGGVKSVRGPKIDFIQTSKELLNTFLLTITQPESENEYVIHPDILGPSNRLPKEEVDEPQPRKPIEALEAFPHKKDAINEITHLIAETFLGRWGRGASVDLPENVVPFFSAFLELPDFDKAWASSQGILQELAVKFNMTWQEGLREVFSQGLREIHAGYQQAVNAPRSAYPKTVETNFEPVAVKVTAAPNWQRYFCDSSLKWNVKLKTWEKDIQTIWDIKKDNAKSKYFNPESAKTPQEKHKLETICQGIDLAAEELKKRTAHSFNITALKTVYQALNKYIPILRSEHVKLRNSILDFTRRHAQELELMHLFVDRNTVTDEQIIQTVFDLYQEGKLGLLDDLRLQQDFAELITEFILVTTEMQQYGKARATCKTLSSISQKINDQLSSSYSGKTRAYILQSLARRSTDWLIHSEHLYNFLTQGANRLRYAEEVDGKYLLRDQKFNRRYLVCDIRNEWTSREKAIDALQDMLKDIRAADSHDEPIRFIKAKMGTGKSDFIFPQAIALLLQEGKSPIMVTTDPLVDQLKASMGHQAFVFKFSINFGLDIVHAHELNQLNDVERQDAWEKLTQPQSVIAHLETLAETLDHLQADGKAILTSPSQIAALRNKRVQLQGILSIMNSGEERNAIFTQLELIKRIEAHFKKESAIYLVDEDINYDICYEHNFATGEHRTIDPIRVNVGEHFLRTIQAKHPQLWDMFVGNNLRAIRNVADEFKEVVRDMFKDDVFWKEVGWNLNDWHAIDEEQFIAFILGKRQELPDGMPPWNPKLDADKQQEKSYVAAFKTFMSRTLDAIRGINPSLERGTSPADGVTAIPFSDGMPKKGVLFGEESENYMHQVCNAIGVNNGIAEEIFRQKYNDLGNLDVQISPYYPDTWAQWGKKIADVKLAKGYKTAHAAFVKDPELGLARLQLSRHLLLDANFVRVFHKQITFNSQDLGIGVDVRVGSGTGQAYALNLADYTEKNIHAAADVVYGETLLCTNLDKPTKTFNDPLEHIKLKAKDPNCCAILNFDYKVMDNEKLAAYLRRSIKRQMVYRTLEDGKLVKKIWNPGEHSFPTAFEPGAVDKNALFIYNRGDARGVDFPLPKGKGVYGVAFVGPGNTEDDMAQLFWRMRQLGMGQQVIIAHDHKTESQIRNIWGEQIGDTVRFGHAMRYFTFNTLDADAIKNVKATIFKEQVPLKTHVDRIVRAPYNLKDIKDTTCLQEIEGSAIYGALNELYVLTNRTRWQQEYQPHETAGPIPFLLNLCKEEIKKANRLDQAFVQNMQAVVAKNKQASFINHARLFEFADTLLDADVTEEEFEQKFATILYQSRHASPEEIAIAREVVQKYFAIRKAIQLAIEDIKNERRNIKHNLEYQTFLTNNLPENIPVESEEGTRSEQQIQQQQQQQQQTKQRKMERVMHVGWDDRATQAINVEHFIGLITGTKQIDMNNRYSSQLWPDNGNILPLDHALRFEKGVRLEPTDAQGMFISHRAWQLLNKMGRVGVPAVELLVVEHAGKYYSAVITAADHEETVAKALMNGRAFVRTLPPPSNVNGSFHEIFEQALKKACADTQATLQNASNFTTRARFNSEESKKFIETAVKQFVQSPVWPKAWGEFNAKMSNLVNSFGLDPKVSELLIYSIEREETTFFEIYQRFQQTIHASDQSDIDIRRIGLYALSNENLSHMLLDAVQRPRENNEAFIHHMVMNKLLLNWTQFSLSELDYLIDYITFLSDHKSDTLFANLNRAIDMEQFKDTETGVIEQKTPRSVELIKRIREEDPEFILQVAKRKLNEEPKDVATQLTRLDRLKMRLRPKELQALDQWINKLSSEAYGKELQHLERLGAIGSILLVRELRARGSAV